MTDSVIDRTHTAPTFPPGFLWGAATAAYQVEGAVTEDGRGECIWDRFCRTAGAVRGADDGAIACDFYHRFSQDIALMRELGLTAFRFSVAWPRVLPEGRGRVNAAGLDFYDRLVDELLASGIEPLLTLYHWDLPVALEDAGGWPERSTADALAEFAGVVAGRLGDRVRRWITVNEPWVAAWLGYGYGMHAPGRRSPRDARAAGHHLLLAHARSAQAIRSSAPAARVGIAIDVSDMRPATASPADAAALREADGERHRWFLDPVFRGAYPPDVVERLGADLPPVRDGDLAEIAAPLDFLGLNYYRREVVARTPDGGHRLVEQAGAPHTDMGWEVAPDGLTDVLVRIDRDYRPRAVVVTENGASYEDVRSNGHVSDPRRRAYLARHIEAVRQAILLGVPVEGYFAWSLLDNFEWAEGYARRFGLIYVDYPTLERIPKESFAWYRGFLAAQRDAASPPPASAPGPG